MAGSFTCTISGCTSEANRKKRTPNQALCEKHYMRIRRHGSPFIRAGKDDRWSRNYWLRYYRILPKHRHTECFGWSGSTHSGGYGLIHCDGMTLYAHRVAYEMANGPVPDTLHVLHSCDNPPCTNPQHLRVGTQVDNMADMTGRNRHGFRVDVPRDVVERLHNEGYSAPAIAQQLGVTPEPIRRMIKELGLTPHRVGRRPNPQHEARSRYDR